MRVSISKFSVPLREPFSYYLGTLTFLPYAKIKIYDSNSQIVGIGEIACSTDVNGETVESSQALVPTLQSILRDKILTNPKQLPLIMDEVNNFVAFNGATLCGVEQALFDIISKKRKQSFFKLFGGKKRNIKIQTTIPYLKSLFEYQKRINEILQKEPDFVKFKVGKDLHLEHDAILYLRAVSPKTRISIDANQRFVSIPEALSFLYSFPPKLFTWTEQLFSKEATSEFAEIKKKTGISQMVDESIHTSRDALLYCQNNWADLLNIKLAKTGGILEAEKIISIARKYKKKYMLGSMVHSELGLKYNLAFSLSKDFITQDFYSYFSLKNIKQPYLINRKNLIINNSTL